MHFSDSVYVCLHGMYVCVDLYMTVHVFVYMFVRYVCVCLFICVYACIRNTLTFSNHG